MTPIEQVRESVTHELKYHPEPFQAVKRNEKRFEFRKDDRDYRVGDNLHLREWIPGSGWDNDGGNEGDYTGDECHRRVDYIIREGFGIPKGYCIMSLALLKTMDGEPVATQPLLEFRSAVSGMWYQNPKAAGTVDAVRLFTDAELPFFYDLDPSPQSDTLTTPLPLSMTEEEIDRIGREQYPPDTTNDGEPWYNHEQATRNMYFKDGLRYASTHTKTITVERTFTLSEVTAYADDLMTAHLDPGRVVDREKDEQGADWIHRARNHVNAKHGVSPDSA